ncbi:ankyrin repeat domain-containing protein [Microbacterium sp. 2FI]|uniref:ankyrin repeat domain-containing protein n=1 Tax=Microbacterium sp. 2FI TaxID=2502193 RepID=UPI0010F5E5B2|nr:ankyrin repeat domain-containing protein [Microbacterium sp. 2FI]
MASADEATALGLTAVAALKRGDTREALALIARGADVDARDDMLDSVLLYAGAEGMDEVVRAALAAGGDLTVTNRYGGIAVIPASERGHVSTVALLIEAGSDLDHVNRLGWTALHEAIVLGTGGPAHQEIVRLLLAGGADPRLPDRDGTTPRELAEQHGWSEIAGLLDTRLREDDRGSGD